MADIDTAGATAPKTSAIVNANRFIVNPLGKTPLCHEIPGEPMPTFSYPVTRHPPNLR